MSTRWRVACILASAALASCSGDGTNSEGEVPDNGPTGTAPVSTFSKSYGGPLHDDARVVLNTDDGGFMLFGSANGIDLRFPDTPQGADFWMQKLDANGNVEHGRVLGTHSLPADTVWRRARPTPDGGVILTGARDLTEQVTRQSNGESYSETVTVGSDVAIAKLDASLRVVWSVTHDSGAWQNYDYFAANGTRAEADDTGVDVWPMNDGGYLVAGLSTANLEDRLGTGFPCEDEPLNELATRARHSPCFDAHASRPGARFVKAVSVVVMRLDANGSLRWSQRLTDNAFDLDGNGIFAGRKRGLVLRATTSGGAVLARAVYGGALVYELGAGGERLWRTALPSDASPSATDPYGIYDPFPTGLLQTRDPGFALSMGHEIFKLDADGEVEWSTDLRDRGMRVINDLGEFCDATAPTQCAIVGVGWADRFHTGNPAPQHGAAWFLSPGGEVTGGSWVVPGTHPDMPVQELTRIVAGSGNTLQLLGADRAGHLLRLSMELRPEDTYFEDLRPGTELALEESEDMALPELRADGRAIRLHIRGGVLELFDNDAQEESTQPLTSPFLQSEVLRSAVQIGPGRYVLAGQRSWPERGIVVMRYDLDADSNRAGRVMWTFNWPTDRTEVLAAAAVRDGGVVLSFAQLSSDEEAQPTGWLLKLDGDGNTMWRRVAHAGLARVLAPMPDGGFATLSDGSLITRVSADGDAVWQRSVDTTADHRFLSAMESSTEGELVLAGSLGARIDIVRLDAAGALQSARELTLPSSEGPVSLDDTRIRHATDGSYVLAMSESGNLTVMDATGAASYGQRNVLVLKLDADLSPQWARIYGARFEEGVRDLAVRADGTIAVAGFSDSLGDLREGWLLKLSADGLISAGGCQALLGSLPVGAIEVGGLEATAELQEAAPPQSPDSTEQFDTFELAPETPEDFVTARQCVGDTSRPTGTPVTQRLSVVQVGTEQGVVTSEPRGISCGTGTDICAADFPRGSVVTLRADPDGFVAWRQDCTEGSGGSRLECVIVLDADRTIEVEFGAEPSPQFSLSFDVEGPGFINTDSGINCSEDTPVEGCSGTFGRTDVIAVTARPHDDYRGSGESARFLGWAGDCESSGTQRSLTLTLDRDLHCIARFEPPNIELLTISVSGAGTVRDVPPGAFNCREGMVGGGCASRFIPGDGAVTLQAMPDFGQRFVEWSGDCALFGAAPVIELDVSHNMTCTARFEQATAPAVLSVELSDPDGTGTVESSPAGIDCSTAPGSACSAPFPPGTRVTLRATRVGVIWSGCDQVFDLSFCRVDVDTTPRSVRASFRPE